MRVPPPHPEKSASQPQKDTDETQNQVMVLSNFCVSSVSFCGSNFSNQYAPRAAVFLHIDNRRKRVPTFVIVIGIIVILIVALLLFIVTRSDKMHIERTAQINAPADVVFAIINDLHQWGLWSPYDKRDPQMQKTYEGAPTGPGSSYAWNGNKDVGEGHLTIVDSKPGELVTMQLEFTRPFACQNRVDFKLVPVTGGTQVSWIMEGKNTFFSKAMSLFISMDKMVGTDFEQGLVNLNAVAEKRA